MVPSCGGDIVGNWVITSSCVKGQQTLTDNAACRTATLRTSLTATGTTSYRADMTYTLAFTVSGTDSVTVPASCLSMGTTCAQANQLFPDAVPGLQCNSAAGGGCNCTLAVPATLFNEVGTYSTSGGSVTTTPSNGTSDTSQYCVRGNRLDLIPPAGMADPGVTMSGDLTLMRQ